MMGRLSPSTLAVLAVTVLLGVRLPPATAQGGQRLVCAGGSMWEDDDVVNGDTGHQLLWITNITENQCTTGPLAALLNWSSLPPGTLHCQVSAPSNEVLALECGHHYHHHLPSSESLQPWARRSTNLPLWPAAAAAATILAHF